MLTRAKSVHPGRPRATHPHARRRFSTAIRTVVGFTWTVKRAATDHGIRLALPVFAPPIAGWTHLLRPQFHVEPDLALPPFSQA